MQGVAETQTVVRPISSEALAEGLMLVRASTLKIIRLQLAMERRDRRVAIEAVDDLVALDRRLQEYLADSPALFGQERLRDELNREAAEVRRDSLGLAAGVVRREPAGESVVSFPAAKPVEALPAIVEEHYGIGEEEPRRRPVLKWVVSGLAAAGVAAGALLVPGSTELLATLAEIIR